MTYTNLDTTKKKLLVVDGAAGLVGNITPKKFDVTYIANDDDKSLGLRINSKGQVSGVYSNKKTGLTIAIENDVVNSDLTLDLGAKDYALKIKNGKLEGLKISKDNFSVGVSRDKKLNLEYHGDNLDIKVTKNAVQGNFQMQW